MAPTMETFRQCVFLLAAQVIVAAALTGSYAMTWVRRRGSRRERATWFRAARAMLRLTPLAVALFLAGAAWILWSDLKLPHFGLVWWVGATIPLTVGNRWMLRAGGLQARARIVPSRLLARLAGWCCAAGCGSRDAVVADGVGRRDPHDVALKTRQNETLSAAKLDAFHRRCGSSRGATCPTKR